jgi:hypothetical protein
MNFALVKLRSDGTVDPSFGVDGVVPNRTPMSLVLQDFLQQPDGKFLLAGANVLSAVPWGDYQTKVTYQPILTRYTPNGMIDIAFGNQGVLKVDSTLLLYIIFPQTAPISTIALGALPNGAGVVAAGEGQGYSTYVARFQGDVAQPPRTDNYQGLWWNFPGGSEAGWGINFAHQGDLIFASWFTFDASGKPWWLVMTANKTSDNTYAGALYQASGPPFDATPFPPLGESGGATGSITGEATLTFSDANNATFAYTLNGKSQTKTITRETFALLPLCTFNGLADINQATNYQDLWWAAPAGSESGWGINIAHQGDTLFATWFTFDADRSPAWMTVTATKTAATSYGGALYQAKTGPPFSSVPFPSLGSAGGAVGVVVGSASFAFSDGNHGVFSYDVNGTKQSKPITREIFAGAGTSCR